MEELAWGMEPLLDMLILDLVSAISAIELTRVLLHPPLHFGRYLLIHDVA